MNKLYNVIGFILVIGAFTGIGFAIKVTAEEEQTQEAIDTRPLISVSTLKPENHEVIISGFGEVAPLETTFIAAQVSGEITSWNPNFVAGGLVNRGDVLFSIEDDQYQANVLQADAQVSLAESTLAEELARQKVAQREAKQLSANKVTDLYLRKPQVLSAKAQLKSAQAQLQIASRNLAKTQVRSPYDALVVSREIGHGQYVNAGEQVAQLNSIETAEIIVPIAGFDRPFIKRNMAREPAIAQLNSPAKESRAGLIHRDLGVVDSSTRMIHVVMRIEDPYGVKTSKTPIVFGSYVEVKFAGKQLNDVYKVPQTLVNNSAIWLVDEDNRLNAQPVHVIREEGSYFYVSGELKNDARMAQNLPEYPQNGMQVRIEPSDDMLISLAD